MNLKSNENSFEKDLLKETLNNFLENKIYESDFTEQNNINNIEFNCFSEKLIFYIEKIIQNFNFNFKFKFSLIANIIYSKIKNNGSLTNIFNENDKEISRILEYSFIYIYIISMKYKDILWYNLRLDFDEFYNEIIKKLEINLEAILNILNQYDNGLKNFEIKFIIPFLEFLYNNFIKNDLFYVYLDQLFFQKNFIKSSLKVKEFIKKIQNQNRFKNWNNDKENIKENIRENKNIKFLKNKIGNKRHDFFFKKFIENNIELGVNKNSKKIIKKKEKEEFNDFKTFYNPTVEDKNNRRNIKNYRRIRTDFNNIVKVKKEKKNIINIEDIENMDDFILNENKDLFLQNTNETKTNYKDEKKIFSSSIKEDDNNVSYINISDFLINDKDKIIAKETPIKSFNK